MVRGLGLVAFAASAAACSGVTSLRLEVSLGTGESAPAELELDVYQGTRALLRDQPLAGATLPGTLILQFAEAEPEVRLVVDGKGPGTSLLGGTRAELVPGRQTSAQVVLSSATLNRDGDRVPDGLDNCADVPNADQSDHDGDGHGDACQGGVDLSMPDLSGIDLDAASSTDQSLPDLSEADLSQPDLSQPDLLQIDLLPPDLKDPSCASAGAALMCDDFESGSLDTTTWMLIGNGNIDSTFRHRGQYSYHFRTTAVSAGTSVNFHIQERTSLLNFSGATVWVRLWAFAPVAPAASGNQLTMIKLEPTSGPFLGQVVQLTPLAVRLENEVGGNAVASSTAPAFNKWACYVFRVDFSGTPGISLSGVDVPTLSILGTTQPNPPLRQVNIGAFFYQPAAAQPAFDLWIDDIIVDNKAIACDR